MRAAFSSRSIGSHRKCEAVRDKFLGHLKSDTLVGPGDQGNAIGCLALITTTHVPRLTYARATPMGDTPLRRRRRTDAPRRWDSYGKGRGGEACGSGAGA
jgi:hypothetical protein